MGFMVWSPFDGQPIPAPNEVERNILLSQGYFAEPPAEGGVAGDVQRPEGESGCDSVVPSDDIRPTHVGIVSEGGTKIELPSDEP
jgi:hypothetical protein